MRRLVLAAVLTALIVVPAAQAWTWPASGAVLEPFLFDPAHPFAAGQHRGIVVGADPGAAVLAPAAGVVTFAGTVPSSGKSVTITTPDGLAVTLTHLGALTVSKNATVAEGAAVATATTAGDADFSQPYVHLGVRVASDAQGYLDPLTFLPPRVPVPPALVPPAPVEPAPEPAPAAQPAPAPVVEPAAAPAPVVTPTPAAVEPPARPEPATTPAPAPPEAPAAAPEPVPAEPAAAEPAAAPSPVAQPEPAAAPAEAAPVVADDVPPAADVVLPATELEAPAPVADDPPPHGAAAPASGPAAPPRADLDALASTAPDWLPRHGVWLSPPAAPIRDLPVHAADASARLQPRGAAAPPRPRLRLAARQPVALLAARATPAAARHDPHGGEPWVALAITLLGVGLMCAGRARRKAVPTMDAHALLRDHPDLLRQRPAAHRSLVHDHRGRHPRAPSPAARRGDVLPDGSRRARDESLACR